MQDDLRGRFRTAFFESLRTDERAPLLKEAALTQRLGAWTRELTAVTVLSCRRLNWKASATAMAYSWATSDPAAADSDAPSW